MTLKRWRSQRKTRYNKSNYIGSPKRRRGNDSRGYQIKDTKTNSSLHNMDIDRRYKKDTSRNNHTVPKFRLKKRSREKRIPAHEYSRAARNVSNDRSVRRRSTQSRRDFQMQKRFSSGHNIPHPPDLVDEKSIPFPSVVHLKASKSARRKAFVEDSEVKRPSLVADRSQRHSLRQVMEQVRHSITQSTPPPNKINRIINLKHINNQENNQLYSPRLSENSNRLRIQKVNVQLQNLAPSPKLSGSSTHTKNGTLVYTRFDLLSVFVDYSNIFIPIKTKYPRCKLNVQRLARIVMGNRQARTEDSLMVGASVVSHPSSASPRTQRWIREWQRCHYKVHVQNRSRGTGESFVDDMIHAQIELPGTLALLTGDGNQNNERSSFPDIAQHALEDGWCVEVWSWAKSTHNVWYALESKYRRMKVYALDDYKKQILTHF